MKKLKLMICFLLVAVIFIPINKVEASSVSATLENVKGDVFVQRGGGKREISAFDGMRVSQGDSLRTGGKSSVKINFGENNEATLSSNAKVTIAQLADENGANQTVVKQESGGLWNRIKNLFGVGDKYEVETSTSVMGVRGTLFYSMMDAEQDGSQVRVLDGAVGVKRNQSEDTEPEQTVSLNQELTVARDRTAPAEPKALEVRSFVEQLDPSLFVTVIDDVIETSKETNKAAQEQEQEFKESQDKEKAKSALSNANRALLLANISNEIVSEVSRSPRRKEFEEVLKDAGRNIQEVEEKVAEARETTQRTREQVTETAKESGAVTEEELKEINEQVDEQIKESEKRQEEARQEAEETQSGLEPEPAPEPTPPPSTPSSPPTLSNVTSTSVTVGGNVTATSNRNGHIFLVPEGTSRLIAALNTAAEGSNGIKVAVQAGQAASLNTAGFEPGEYVVFAVDGNNQISTRVEVVIESDLRNEPLEEGAISLTIAGDNLNDSFVDTQLYVRHEVGTGRFYEQYNSSYELLNDGLSINVTDIDGTVGDKFYLIVRTNGYVIFEEFSKEEVQEGVFRGIELDESYVPLNVNLNVTSDDGSYVYETVNLNPVGEDGNGILSVYASVGSKVPSGNYHIHYTREGNNIPYSLFKDNVTITLSSSTIEFINDEIVLVELQMEETSNDVDLRLNHIAPLYSLGENFSEISSSYFEEGITSIYLSKGFYDKIHADYLIKKEDENWRITFFNDHVDLVENTQLQFNDRLAIDIDWHYSVADLQVTFDQPLYSYMHSTVKNNLNQRVEWFYIGTSGWETVNGSVTIRANGNEYTKEIDSFGFDQISISDVLDGAEVSGEVELIFHVEDSPIEIASFNRTFIVDGGNLVPNVADIEIEAATVNVDENWVALTLNVTNTGADLENARYGVEVTVEDIEDDSLVVHYDQESFTLNRVDQTDKFIGYFGPPTGFTLESGWNEELTFNADLRSAIYDRTVTIDVWVGQGETPAKEDAIATMEQVEFGVEGIYPPIAEQPPEQTLADAKVAADAVLEDLVATNETTKEQILDAVSSVITNGNISVTFRTDDPFNKQEATINAAGWITGTIQLSINGVTPEDVFVNLQIAQLAVTTEIHGLNSSELTINFSEEVEATDIYGHWNGKTPGEILNTINNSTDIETETMQFLGTFFNFSVPLEILVADKVNITGTATSFTVELKPGIVDMNYNLDHGNTGATRIDVEWVGTSKFKTNSGKAVLPPLEDQFKVEFAVPYTHEYGAEYGESATATFISKDEPLRQPHAPGVENGATVTGPVSIDYAEGSYTEGLRATYTIDGEEQGFLSSGYILETPGYYVVVVKNYINENVTEASSTTIKFTIEPGVGFPAPVVTYEFSGFDNLLDNGEMHLLTITATGNIDNDTNLRYKAVLTDREGISVVDKEIMYYEETTVKWKTLTTDENGIVYFGPPEGFTASAVNLEDGLTTQFKVSLSEGDYRLEVSLVEVIEPGEYGEVVGDVGEKEFTVEAVPTVTYGYIGSLNFTAGTEHEFSINAKASNIDADIKLRHKMTLIKEATGVGGLVVSYQENGVWKTFETDESGGAYFGPATGFTPEQVGLKEEGGVTTNFRATLDEGGNYRLVVQLVEVNDQGEVIRKLGEKGEISFDIE